MGYRVCITEVGIMLKKAMLFFLGIVHTCASVDAGIMVRVMRHRTSVALCFLDEVVD